MKGKAGSSGTKSPWSAARYCSMSRLNPMPSSSLSILATSRSNVAPLFLLFGILRRPKHSRQHKLRHGYASGFCGLVYGLMLFLRYPAVKDFCLVHVSLLCVCATLAQQEGICNTG